MKRSSTRAERDGNLLNIFTVRFQCRLKPEPVKDRMFSFFYHFLDLCSVIPGYFLIYILCCSWGCATGVTWSRTRYSFSPLCPNRVYNFMQVCPGSSESAVDRVRLHTVYIKIFSGQKNDVIVVRCPLTLPILS